MQQKDSNKRVQLNQMRFLLINEQASADMLAINKNNAKHFLFHKRGGETTTHHHCHHHYHQQQQW